MQRPIILAVLAIAAFSGACSSDSQFPVANGEGRVRALNAIATAPEFSFLIEERVIGTAAYKTSTSTRTYDALDYVFNFEVALTGDTSFTRVASQPLAVERDRDYTFLITGVIDAPTISVWEGDVREWDGSETAFEVRFAHTAALLADIDIYFAAPGVAPVLGSELATLAFGEISASSEYELGEFVLIVTAAGDPSTVLFESDPVTPVQQTSIILSVFDSDPNDLSPLSVRLINTTSGGSGSLSEANFPPTGRFYHASINLGAVDIYIDDPLTTPLVSAHAFKDVTPELPIFSGSVPLTYTTAGNMGSILIDIDRSVSAGTRTNFYVINEPAGEDIIISANLDRRPIETTTRISFMNAAANLGPMDVYVVTADASIDDVGALLPSLPAATAPVAVPLLPDSYDIYLTVPREKTILLGPIRFDGVGGDIFETVFYDTADPAVPELVFIPPP